MQALDTPLQLEPIFKPRIWGCSDLAPFFAAARRPAGPSAGGANSQGATADLIGEVWLTDDASRFLNGPVAGLTLGEAGRAYGQDLHGKGWQGDRFPVLAKYLFTSDWLSLQVHPDDEEARKLQPGSLGKSEMWYVLRVDQNSGCLLGLRPGVSKEELRTAIQRGNGAELLCQFRPEAAEAVFVPPGTVHALGAGLVLFEAEQNSDLTYRLHDWGRMGPDGKPRALHLENGLEVTRPEAPAHRDLPRLEFAEPWGLRRYVVASRHFAVEEWLVRKKVRLQGSAARVEILSILSGEGRVETAAGWLAYGVGDTWLIPPAAEPFRLAPEGRTRLLRLYLPDLDNDFRRPLAQRGVRESEIRKVVFE